ncbi:hypothetical protein [Microbacterium sp.]|uniref:hypothetical protein n=1 Tax=Microbacterium sp. TaxID=51671 RepID=UPI003F967A7A
MPTYGEIESIIGKMKRAAIDCWMADQSFYPAWGNEETYCKWHWAPYQYHRPDANGAGGGTSVGYGDGVTCVAQFDGIRSSIDAVVSKWLDLPDGSECGDHESKAATSAGILGASGADPTVQNTGEIGTASLTIHDSLIGNANMQGAYIRPFHNKYYTKFSAVRGSLGQASLILQANYAAQAALWSAAQEDVAKICDDARAAWETQAGLASTASTTFQLAVASAAVTAIGGVITATTIGPAVVGVAAVTFGMSTAVSAAAQDASVGVSGDSYESILSSLETALEKLSQSIKDQEDALSTSMDEAVAAMNADLSTCNLDAVDLGDYPLHDEDSTMAMNQTDAGIISDNMTNIETELTSVTSTFGSPPASNPTPRSWGIGATNGSHTAASGLHQFTARCLELTSAEYARGHELFNATVDDYNGADASARQQVQTLLAEEEQITEMSL